MEVCKYLLPCGYCDKYDIPCKAKREDMEAFFKNKENRCNHVWIDEPDANGDNTILRCLKCGWMKVNIEEKCEHNWAYAGKSTAGENYKCTKCGMINVYPPNFGF